MRINLLGQRNHLGGGRHFSEFADAMRSLRVIGDAVSEFDYFSLEDQEECLKNAGSDDINIHFFNVNALAEKGLAKRWPRLPGMNIHWAIFESTELFRAMVEWLETADLVFVPSAWGKDVLIKHGILEDKIEVVPEGVDPAKFHPLARSSYVNRQDDIYRVLVVSKFEERKGFPELLDGYARAFGNDPTAKLLLKSDNLWMQTGTNNAYEDNIAQLEREVQKAGISNVSFLNGALSDDDLSHLYNASDVLLFPSRAEGWGLPLIEAIATGLPAVTTYYSGHTEFLRPIKDKIAVLDHEMLPMGPGGKSGEWASASADEIAAKLVEARQNRAEYDAQALLASRIMRETFSWQKAAEVFVGIIEKRFGLFQVSLNI